MLDGRLLQCIIELIKALVYIATLTGVLSLAVGFSFGVRGLLAQSLLSFSVALPFCLVYLLFTLIRRYYLGRNYGVFLKIRLWKYVVEVLHYYTIFCLIGMSLSAVCYGVNLLLYEIGWVWYDEAHYRYQNADFSNLACAVITLILVFAILYRSSKKYREALRQLFSVNQQLQNKD